MAKKARATGGAKVAFSEAAAICGNFDMARSLVQRFGESERLFTLLETPWTHELDEHNTDVQRAFNVLASIVPALKFLFLCQCSDELCRLAAADKRVQCIPVSTVEELEEVLSGFPSPAGQKPARRGKLAVIEETKTVAQVIAENFASTFGYEPAYIPSAGKNDIDEVEESLRQWDAPADHFDRASAKARTLALLEERLAGVAEKINQAHEIVYFTEGIPYGILPQAAIVSHLWMRRDLGLQLLRGEIQRGRRPSISAALLCEAGGLENTELEPTRKLLDKNDVKTVALSGHRTTRAYVEALLHGIPFDLLLITTHITERKGRRRRFAWSNSVGKTYELVMDEYQSMSTVPNDQVSVVTMEVPLTVNGLRWGQQAEEISAIGFTWLNTIGLARAESS